MKNSGKYSGLFSFIMFLFSNMFPLLKEYFNPSVLIYLSCFLHRQLLEIYLTLRLNS